MKTLTLTPCTQAFGEMTLPGSKSLSIRALLLSALAQGTTELTGVLDSDDTRVMIAALQQLGVAVRPVLDNETQMAILGAWQITGVLDENNQPVKLNSQADIFVGNSGLSIRTLAAALARLDGNFRLHGVPRMHERPIGDLVESLAAFGASIEYEATAGYPPLRIKGNANATVAPITVRGNASSQYLTGLLQIAPLAARTQDIVIHVAGELISKPYVDMTIALMAQFGVVVARDAATGYQSFIVTKGSAYVSPGTLQVEGDASSASYFLAMGALGAGVNATHKNTLTVHGAGTASLQGDVKFASFLETLSVQIDWQAQSMTVHAAVLPLPAFNADFNHIPDAAMTAAVIALFCDGPSTLRNIASWRVKETDRLAAMATELRKCGAEVVEGEDWLQITPPSCLAPPQPFLPCQIATYDDHRMAMCGSLLRFTGQAVTIEDPACVNKTFPNYFTEMEKICHP